MAGLACGEPSPAVLPLLSAAAAAFALDDETVPPAMKLLAEGVAGDAKIVAGASGAASVAALMAALDQPDLSAGLGLDSDSRVVVIVTEGDTTR